MSWDSVESGTSSNLPKPIALDLLSGKANDDQAPIPLDAGGTKADESPRRELVFIDESVDDYEALLEGLFGQRSSREVEIHVLDRRRDGIDQISEILTRHRGLDAVHIFSHATEGAVRLGDSRLDAEALDTRADQFRAWSEALDSRADLLIYGCDLVCCPGDI